MELVEAFSTEMPFADASFDVVLSSLFFHHLEPGVKRTTLAEVARVLRPGGRLHVADWGKPSDPLMRALFTTVRAFDGFAVTAENARGALPELFESAGLERATRAGAATNAARDAGDLRRSQAPYVTAARGRRRPRRR